MASLLPPRPFGSTLLARTAVVWLFFHGTMAFLPSMMTGSAALRAHFPRSLVGSPLTLLWITAATAMVLWFEMWRHREFVFLANLGYSAVRLEGIVVTECLLLELALRISLA